MKRPSIVILISDLLKNTVLSIVNFFFTCQMHYITSIHGIMETCSCSPHSVHLTSPLNRYYSVFVLSDQ